MKIARPLLPLLLVLSAASPPAAAHAQDPPAPDRVFFPEIMVGRGRLGFAYTADVGGVRIDDVLVGSPAMRAGVQRGDTIVRVNDREANPREMMRLGMRLEPGDTVRLGLRRAGRVRELFVVAEARPHSFSYAPGPGGHGLFRADSVERLMRVFMDSARSAMKEWTFEADSTVWIVPRTAPGAPRSPAAGRAPGAAPFRMLEAFARNAVAGAEFTELNADLAKYFSGTREGLLVLRVAPGTPAERSGLRAGDVVVAVEDQPVRTIQELRHALSAGGGNVGVDVVREGRKLALRLGRK